MKLNKVVAIPAIALAAGLSLAACGSSGSSGGGGNSPSSSSPQATACADWAQAKAESTTAKANVDIVQAVNTLGTSASAAGSNVNLWEALDHVYVSAQTGSSAGVQVYARQIDQICAAPAPTTTSAPAAAPAPATPAPTTPAPVATTPAPAPTVYMPVQAPVGPVAQSDPWNVAVAYTSAINSGNNWGAWNMLSSSVQSHGWGGSYNTYVADFTPLSFDNVTYSSSSGDSVTFTFTLHNHSTGSESFTTCTFTVDNGVITSST